RYFYSHHITLLEDKSTGEMIDLHETNTYTYAVGEVTGDVHDRFVLHLLSVTTDLEDLETDQVAAGNQIQIKSLGSKVMVSVNTELLVDGPGSIEVFTIEGRKVAEVPALSSRTLVFLPDESGVYIVRARFGNKVKSER